MAAGLTCGEVCYLQITDSSGAQLSCEGIAVEIGGGNVVVAVGDCAYREVEGRFREREELGTEGAGVVLVCGVYLTFISAPISQVFVNAPGEWEDVQLLEGAVLGHLVVRRWNRQMHAIPLTASDADPDMRARPSLSERRDPASHLGEPPAEGRSSGRSAGLGGGAEHGGAETQLMMMQVMEAMLERVQKPQSEDQAEGSLDGLRVVKALSRLRELKTRMHENPKEVYKAFKELWEEELGAAGKPWTWLDVSHHIPFGKFASIKRMHVLMGTVLSMLEHSRTDLAMAQLSQNMKVLQEFTVSGSWELAWPHSYVVDPINPKRHGAKEEELEAVSGYVRVQHDLEETSRKLGRGLVDSEDEKTGERLGHRGQKANAEPTEK